MYIFCVCRIDDVMDEEKETVSGFTRALKKKMMADVSIQLVFSSNFSSTTFMLALPLLFKTFLTHSPLLISTLGSLVSTVVKTNKNEEPSTILSILESIAAGKDGIPGTEDDVISPRVMTQLRAALKTGDAKVMVEHALQPSCCGLRWG